MIMDNRERNVFARKVYICQNKDDKVRFDSTSGGVFSALSKYVISKNGFVFGAEFDDDFRVLHGRTKLEEDLSRFRGSKYVQSHLGDSFREVKNLLDDNQWVLFSGTPCQIEGLVSFLGKEYERLVLMDIVCYSISSPEVWKRYLQHLVTERKINKSEVARIKFRDKAKYGYEYTLMTFYDANSNEIFSSGPESNQMLRSFVSNTSTRPSCYKCQFKKINRVSDFTAWDCYNVYQYQKKLDDNKGTSHIMVHSEKGNQILAELVDYMQIIEVELKKAVESEPAMTESATPSNQRFDFFEKFGCDEDVFDLFFPDTPRVKFERTVRKILSKTGLYSFAKRMIKH